MAINIYPEHERALIEGLKHYGQFMQDSLGHHRCPMCGCDIGYGTRWNNRESGEDYIQYCLGDCGYEEYV